MTTTTEAFPALIFCPADRPERYQKALDRADTVIIDLEDAVLPDAKEFARASLLASDLPPERVIVRVNAPDTAEFQLDIETVLQTKYRTVMVAKSENADSLSKINPELRLIALCETALGVREAERIAELDNIIGLMWGAEDLIASMGGTSSRKEDGSYREIAKFARSRVLLAARAAGKIAIDAVHLDIQDLDGLNAEASDAVASGFQATACIHPGQVETIRAAYRPAEGEVLKAKKLLAAAEGQRGVFSFEGQMVDEPVLRHAREVLERGKAAQNKENA